MHTGQAGVWWWTGVRLVEQQQNMISANMHAIAHSFLPTGAHTCMYPNKTHVHSKWQ